MSFPVYNEINKLLQANGTGLTSELDEFHSHRMKILTRSKPIKRPAHRTDFYGIVLIEEGRGKMSVNSRTIEFQPGMIAFTSPGQIVTFEVDAITNGYVIYFLPHFLPTIYSTTLENEYPFFKRDANAILVIEGPINTYKALFETILAEYKARDTKYVDVIKSYLLVLLNLFNRFYAQTAPIPVSLEAKNRKYALTHSFDALVRHHLPDRKRLSFYAGQLFISEKHLIDVIKSTTGKTPLEYAQNIFLQEAKLLLTYTNQTVAEVAYSLNFNDPSYFNKVFKKHFNMTPLAFRQQLAK